MNEIAKQQFITEFFNFVNTVDYARFVTDAATAWEIAHAVSGHERAAAFVAACVAFEATGGNTCSVISEVG